MARRRVRFDSTDSYEAAVAAADAYAASCEAEGFVVAERARIDDAELVIVAEVAPSVYERAMAILGAQAGDHPTVSILVEE